MSDGVTQGQSTAFGETNSGQFLSAGGMLRSAREAAGLHVAALAVSMKVPVKKLEALEADRLDLLPDIVFVRALASSVCRTLKIDPTPILEKLPRSGAQPLIPEDRVINTPFRAHGESLGFSAPGFLKKPSVLAVLALLVGAGAVFYFPEFQSLKQGSVEDVVATTVKPLTEVMPPVVPLAQDDAVPLAAPMEVSDTAASATAVQPPSNAASSAVDATTSRVQANSNGAAVVTTSVEKSLEVVVPPPSMGLLSLKASAPSWVQVVDAKGVVQLSRTLVVGEAADVTGVAPLTVVIGRADALEVAVRGKPFSLLGVAKDNVARFEVK